MVLDFAKHNELQKSFQSFSGEFAEICRITHRHTHTHTDRHTDRKLGCYTYKNPPQIFHVPDIFLRSYDRKTPWVFVTVRNPGCCVTDTTHGV